MKSSLITTADAVIDALGGVTAVAELAGTTVQSACNWRSFGRFPARTYILFKRALAVHELQAPPSLWGMVEPAPPSVTKRKRRAVR